MAKFRNGDLVLTTSQQVIQGGVSVINSNRDGKFTSLALSIDAYAVSINEFSTDGTLIGDSDAAIPTEKAVKTYVDNKISGSILASTDNALARYDGTDGIQGSGIVIDDFNNISQVGNFDSTGNIFTTVGYIGTGNTTDFAVMSPAGGIELSNSSGAAFIDFKTAEAEDFDCRIIQDTNGFRFYTGGNGSTVNALTINSAQNVIIPKNLSIQGTTKSAGYLYVAGLDPDYAEITLNYDGFFKATKVYNAVWG